MTPAQALMYLQRHDKTKDRFDTVTGFPRVSLSEAHTIRAKAKLREQYEAHVRR